MDAAAGTGGTIVATLTPVLPDPSPPPAAAPAANSKPSGPPAVFGTPRSVGLVLLEGRLTSHPPASGLPPTLDVQGARTRLRAARDDPSVVAVVVRVDSAGGEALASEAVRYEIEMLRASGKPVVASIGAVGAGGGYLVASAASTIVAQPCSLTGGLSAHADIVDASRGLRKLRAGVSVHATGAEPLSVGTPLSTRQTRELRALVNATEAEMAAHVQSVRGLSKRAMRRAGRGHVWTGEQAKRIGLVDALGGVDTACALAADAAGLGQEYRAGSVRVNEMSASAARMPRLDGATPDAIADGTAALIGDVATVLTRIVFGEVERSSALASSPPPPRGLDAGAANAAALALSGGLPRPIICDELPPSLARGL